MRGGSLPRGGSLLLLLASSCPVLGSLTLQEAFECQSHPGMIAFEMHGGVLLEGCLMAYILLVLYVLIEEHYVPTLELISTKEVLNIPASLVGCTIMSAGNCIGDLSISLVAMMVSGAEVGTGEVLGACVFDLLCVLGLVCILLPPEGLELPKPLMYYFMVWVVLATSLDAMLFYTSVELTWYMANVMVLAYILDMAAGSEETPKGGHAEDRPFPFGDGVSLMPKASAIGQTGWAGGWALAPEPMPTPNADAGFGMGFGLGQQG